MRPERLEFCGINSFSERAVIDFKRLLAGGIFGIFGDTGSGKTTILDSMIFALYGKVTARAAHRERGHQLPLRQGVRRFRFFHR